jgi:hypothetical protein
VSCGSKVSREFEVDGSTGVAAGFGNQCWVCCETGRMQHVCSVRTDCMQWFFSMAIESTACIVSALGTSS